MKWRKATTPDIEPLHAIYMHESVSPYLGFDVCSRDEFRTIFRDMREAGDLLVFEDNGTIVGVINVVRREHRLPHVAYLGSLAVRPDRSGQGIGTAIVTTVLKLLQTEGMRRVEILVAKDNAKAIGLFESLGFAIEGPMRNYSVQESSKKLFDENEMASLMMNTRCEALAAVEMSKTIAAKTHSV